MDATFENDEILLRSVLPADMFIKRDGTLTGAAFRDKRVEGAEDTGISVDRTGDRALKPAVEFALSHLKGVIAGVTVLQCVQTGAVVKYLPLEKNEHHEKNEYHSEIHKSETEVRLTKSQAKYLADNARFLGGTERIHVPYDQNSEGQVITVYWPTKEHVDK